MNDTDLKAAQLIHVDACIEDCYLDDNNKKLTVPIQRVFKRSIYRERFNPTSTETCIAFKATLLINTKWEREEGNENNLLCTAYTDDYSFSDNSECVAVYAVVKKIIETSDK